MSGKARISSQVNKFFFIFDTAARGIATSYLEQPYYHLPGKLWTSSLLLFPFGVKDRIWKSTAPVIA